jgi:hypothetical protein
MPRSRRVFRFLVLGLLLVGTACGGRAVQPVGESGPVAAGPAEAPIHASPAAPAEPEWPTGVRARNFRLPVWERPEPGLPDSFLRAHNPIGQWLVLLSDGTRTDRFGEAWFRVLLPKRPNGSRGWVRERDVWPVELRERIVVDLSAFTLRHYREGRLVQRVKVGIGQPQWPTPTGRYYVWARVPQESAYGPYGVYALGLSALSDVLTDWPGGGRVAIHGTANPSNAGHAVSHGCVRVFNDAMERLKRVPLGTPVVVRA